MGETKPYRLPELLPPASDPKPLEFSEWRAEDFEVFVAYFEEHQASLADCVCVRLLKRAAECSCDHLEVAGRNGANLGAWLRIAGRLRKQPPPYLKCQNLTQDEITHLASSSALLSKPPRA